ncbi:non-functional pseudokinase ZED1-like [Amaranthus tricolor]|uniref:non-functional pseudokinase ZED1-like n=1 Tax=Amaranthus tricolor TaxID=29722 RepID=UPI0025862529|nr:non-functional pseudokinase ZED1-like [Amaranthus tricolor]
MKLKLIVEWIQRLKKLPECIMRCGDKYFIFQGSHQNYLRNGALLLEESIALFHGRANPLRPFSVGELNTMNVETLPIYKFYFHHLYKGSWEGRDVLVGKDDNMKHKRHWEYVLHEIVVATQMATHTNVHKLIGCCLETVKPVLVYESLDDCILLEDKTPLDDCILLKDKTPLDDCILLKDETQNQRLVLEWKDRLRIAWEISHTIAYLHTAFPRPIIYRNLNPNSVFLSPESAIKLCDFSLCVSIPKDQEFFMSEDLLGTIGFIAPEYFHSGEVRESTDVFTFGVLFLMLLTGKFPRKDDLVFLRKGMTEMCINKMIDPKITRNGVTDIEELQLRYSIQTALLCVSNKENCRPTMVEVAMELMNIIKSPQNIVTSSKFKMFQLNHYNDHTTECDDEFYDCDNDNNDNNDEEYYDCEQNKDQCNDNA